MPTDTQGPEKDLIPALRMGLRQLILSGEQFRHVLGRQLQLGSSDLMAMDHLYSDGPLTPRELATRLKMTSGTMTTLLDRVEKAGFLSRNENPQDRRSLLIKVTPAGQHAMQWVYEQFDDVLRGALLNMPAATVEQVTALLTILGEALEQRVRTEVLSSSR